MRLIRRFLTECSSSGRVIVNSRSSTVTVSPATPSISEATSSRGTGFGLRALQCRFAFELIGSVFERVDDEQPFHVVRCRLEIGRNLEALSRFGTEGCLERDECAIEDGAVG